MWRVRLAGHAAARSRCPAVVRRNGQGLGGDGRGGRRCHGRCWCRGTIQRRTDRDLTHVAWFAVRRVERRGTAGGGALCGWLTRRLHGLQYGARRRLHGRRLVGGLFLAAGSKDQHGEGRSKDGQGTHGWLGRVERGAKLPLCSVGQLHHPCAGSIPVHHGAHQVAARSQLTQVQGDPVLAFTHRDVCR